MKSSMSDGEGIPEIIRRVSVSHQDNGNGGIVFDGVYSVGRARVVLLGMGREGSKERFSIYLQHLLPFSKVGM